MKRPAFISGVGLATLLVLVANVIQHQLRTPYTPWRCTLPLVHCPSPLIQGYVHPDYQRVRDIFEANLASGDDNGAGVAVFVQNELVVDLQGGWQKLNPRIPFTEDTLQLVYSSTKMLANIITAQFVQKGLLDYDAPIAWYWPEFAQGHKENVTLSDLVQHSAGVGYLDTPLKEADFRDPDSFSQLLARQPHNFGGAKTRSYHAMTGGWYLNEILRRVDPQGRTIGQIAEAELLQNYGVEWHLSANDDLEPRLAQIYRPPVVVQLKPLLVSIFSGQESYMVDLLRKKSVAYRTLVDSTPNQVPVFDLVKSDVRKLEGPSYNGYTNAFSIAKLAAMMANRGRAVVQGEPDLLDEKTYAIASAPMPLAYDILIRRPMATLKGGFGFNYEYAVDGVIFTGWTGAGGSVFYWNEEYRIGFGYLTNALKGSAPDARSLSLLHEIVYQAKKQKSPVLP
ncbi:beta-lactamase/transpeptidase-like protein [Hesseltinella vesiculosa]|uniref:Beta-lactamase/transpeptidase-like protein n=1 Tax=Hesseltinella vesiculosa TaxID=101127 RepID=A0A1X2G3D9_9FUNG|nr:beta-lactamase/transpeptidase-like protein [Hesseltinella vesiculosa]